MSIPRPFSSPAFRLGLLLWLLSMVGAAVAAAEDLPRFLQGHSIPIPMWLLITISLAQTGVLLAVAVWAGVALSPAVGLRAPACDAALRARPVLPAVTPQVVPALLAGALGAGGLLILSRYTPPDLAQVGERFSPSLLARLLYGGITEEVLIRWGVMTTLLWLAWRFVYGRASGLGRTAVWLVITISAIIFGLGHLPAVAAFTGQITVVVASFVVAANAVFGILFGWLFWRYGLECAMIAHAAAHLISYAVERL